MRDLNEATYKIRHTLILDDKYVLEVLQSKNWSYFIEKVLEVFQGDILSLKLIRAEEDIKIINDTFDNLTVCKDTYYISIETLVVHSKCFCKQCTKNILKI